jgi:hypothetical protein
MYVLQRFWSIFRKWNLKLVILDILSVKTVIMIGQICKVNSDAI